MALMFKIGALTLKTAAKPLAAQFERYVMNHPVLRDKVFRVAQALHALEVRLARRYEGKTGAAFVGAISDAEALKLASKVASEGFVYGTALVLLLWETNRRAAEDAAKRRAHADEVGAMQALHRAHAEAEAALAAGQAGLEELLRRMDERMAALEAALEPRPAGAGGGGAGGGGGGGQPAPAS